MGLVVRLVIQDKRSEQGIVIVLGHLMEVKDVSDLIAKKQHATLKDVQVAYCHILLYYFNQYPEYRQVIQNVLIFKQLILFYLIIS